ncbi:MAG: ATP-binding protein [Ktedonobacterales bacterium]
MRATLAVGGSARRGRLLGIATRRQSYLNLAYMLAAGPLGAFYVLVLGLLLAIGVGLSFVLVGIPLLVFSVALWLTFAAYERELTIWWLGIAIAPMSRPLPPGLTWWQRLLAQLRNPVTWKSVLYLALKFAFGLLAGVLLCALLAAAALLLSAPVWILARIVADSAGATLAPLLVLSPLGVAAGALVAVGTLRVSDLLAALWARIAQALLGESDVARRLAEARAIAAQATAQAARAEQSRRELIVNVSHELRTPLASIRGHVDSLLMAAEDAEAGALHASTPSPDWTNEAAAKSVSTEPRPEEFKAYLGIVQRETERLGALVEDLLALARGEAGELRLAPTLVDGAAVVEEVYAALAPLARRERQVTLVLSVPQGVPPVWADRQRLAQVLLNLARNAITYTPAGGIVSLSLEPAGPGAVAFLVADTGMGIAPEDLPQVFERFFRTDASRARATGGFGLGLAIARELVQALGGTITVESQINQGSTFRVVLRTAVPPPPATKTP